MNSEFNRSINSQFFLGLLFSLCGCATFAESTGGISSELIGKFRNTNYYIAYEADYNDAQTSEVVQTMSGAVIANVGPTFKKHLNIEGTGKLKDGRVVNYAGRYDKDIRYRVTEHQFGDGVGTCALMPFKTVAMDSSMVALGSVVKIDESVGMKLPDGTVHNGLWRVEDIGDAIKKDRVDLFIGKEGNNKYLVDGGITHLKALTIRVVQAPPLYNCADQEHVTTE